MRKKKLNFLMVVALCLCLPLSGMSALWLNCTCSGEATNGQQAVNTNQTDQQSGCCEKNQTPQPNAPCPCDRSSCGSILETKKINPAPYLTEANAFAEVTDLKTERGAFLNLDLKFLINPDPFPQQVLYLQIQTLRC